MFCAKCGAKLSDQAKFCGKCGNPVKIRKQEAPVMPTVDEDLTVALPTPEMQVADENLTVALTTPEIASMDEDLTVALPMPEMSTAGEDLTVALTAQESSGQYAETEMLFPDEMQKMSQSLPEHGEFVPRMEDIGGYRKPEQVPEEKKSKTTVILIIVLVLLILASLAAGAFFLKKAGIGLPGMKNSEKEQTENEAAPEDGETDAAEDGQQGEDGEDAIGDGDVTGGETPLDSVDGSEDAQGSADAESVDVSSLTTDPQSMNPNTMYGYFHGTFGEPGKSIQDSSTAICTFLSGKDDEPFVCIYASSGDITYTYAQVAGYNENTILFDSVDSPSMTICYTDADVIEVTVEDSKMTFERADLGLESLLSQFEGTYSVADSAEVDATHPDKITIHGFNGSFSDVCVSAGNEEFRYADVVLGESADELRLVGKEHVYKVKKTEKGIKYSGVKYEKQ